ncbi:hypothetical protein L7F22_028774 [Adiantum nelumboides]|nr:hypothetical protein [Adiantum nelumboides]
MSSYSNQTGETTVRYKHILTFYKTNVHGAQVYLDPNEEYAIRIDDHDIEFEEEVRTNKQRNMYMDRNGTQYLKLENPEIIDKWGLEVNTMIPNLNIKESPLTLEFEGYEQVDLKSLKRKIQLKNELNIFKKENLSINDYTLKIKGIVESLASIGVQVEDDDKVEVCLRGLTPAYKLFKTSIQTSENIPCFADLVPMLVVEEKKLGEGSSSSQGFINFEQVFCSNRGKGRGRGAGQGQGRGRGN